MGGYEKKAPVAYLVIDNDESDATPFTTMTYLFATLAHDEWDFSFFEKNIEDLIKGEEVVYESPSGIKSTYRFYNADDFSDLDA